MACTVAVGWAWSAAGRRRADPQPQVCYGRSELETALQQRAERGLTSQPDEVIANGDRVVVGYTLRGIDAFRWRQTRDRNYDALPSGMAARP